MKFHQLQVTYGEIVAFVLLIDDDKVIPDMFDIGWSIDIDESGVKIESERVKDAEGVETGYRFLHPIKDLEHDLPMLKPAAFSFDRERTFAWRDFVDDLLDDVLLGASARTTRS
ncbi:MAG: hypothetical protein ACUVR3_11705 [Candidatus Roseilinea sp.]|uniref:hypothetical protein n=1 Tax=Candidatus Roseilinea sp. TaxID=2838777 RepID=UPI004048F5DA